MTIVDIKVKTPIENAKELLDESNSLQLRIKRGELRGELGQPHKQPGQSNEQYVQRVATIDERNVSHVIKSMTLNEDGSMTCTCQVLETPSGKIAKEMLEKRTDLSLGLRAFVGPEKHLSVITFDLINK